VLQLAFCIGISTLDIVEKTLQILHLYMKDSRWYNTDGTRFSFCMHSCSCTGCRNLFPDSKHS